MTPTRQPPRTMHARYYVNGIAMRTSNPADIQRHAINHLRDQLAAVISDAMTVKRTLNEETGNVVFEADVVVLTPEELLDYVQREAMILTSSMNYSRLMERAS